MSKYDGFGLTIIGIAFAFLGEASFALSVENTQEFRRTQSKVVLTVNVSEQCKNPIFEPDLSYKQVFARCDLDLNEWKQKGFEYLAEQRGGSHFYPGKISTIPQSYTVREADVPQIAILVEGVTSLDEGKAQINRAIALGHLRAEIVLLNRGGEFLPIK